MPPTALPSDAPREPAARPGGDAWRGVARRLEGDAAWRERVTIRIADELHRALEGLARDSELRHATHASVGDNVRQFLARAGLGEDPHAAEPRGMAAEYVAVLVRRGVPAAVLAEAYRIAHGVFWRTWTEQLHADVAAAELGAAVEDSSAFMFAFMDALTTRAVRLHGEERERWVRSPDAVQAETIRALVDGDPIDPDAAERRLRHPLLRHHVALVLWTDPQRDPDLHVDLPGAARALAAGLSTARPLVHAVGRDVVACWASSAAPVEAGAIAALALPADARGVVAAVGSCAPGVAGFRLSHHEALGARRIAQLRGAAPGSVTPWAAVAASALASTDVDQARRFVEATLGPLAAADARSRALATTLRAYLEAEGSVRAAASALGVHENTVANRLARTREVLTAPVEGRVGDVLLALALLPVTHR